MSLNACRGSPGIKNMDFQNLFFTKISFYFSKNFVNFSRFFRDFSWIFSCLKHQKYQSNQDQWWSDQVNRSDGPDLIKVSMVKRGQRVQIRSADRTASKQVRWSNGCGKKVNRSKVDRVSRSLRGPRVRVMGRRADLERQKRCRSLSL